MEDKLLRLIKAFETIGMGAGDHLLTPPTMLYHFGIRMTSYDMEDFLVYCNNNLDGTIKDYMHCTKTDPDDERHPHMTAFVPTFEKGKAPGIMCILWVHYTRIDDLLLFFEKDADSTEEFITDRIQSIDEALAELMLPPDKTQEGDLVK